MVTLFDRKINRKSEYDFKNFAIIILHSAKEKRRFIQNRLKFILNYLQLNGRSIKSTSSLFSGMSPKEETLLMPCALKAS